MRRAAVVALLGALSARPAEACQVFCVEEIVGFQLVNTRPVPRDGAIALQIASFVEHCADEIAPGFGITVKRDGVAVVGEFEAPGGTGRLYFRPDRPWKAGERHRVKVVFDNAESVERGDCPFAPERVVEEFEFEASHAFSPPLPEPPAPVLTTVTRPIEDQLDNLVCCPETFAEHDSCFGDLYWDESEGKGCAYLYEQTYWQIAGAPFAVPDGLEQQLVFELLVDGVVVGREVEVERLAAIRTGSACAAIEVIHVGTGERVRSAEACTTAEGTATLGLRTRDVAAELPCAAPVVCPEFESDGACTPFDPAAPPQPPMVMFTDTQLFSDCAGVLGPGEGTPAVLAGCRCGHVVTDMPPWALLVVLLARRRRHSLSQRSRVRSGTV